jgi:hypothetical protein
MFLRYFAVLVFIPQVVLGGGLLIAWHVEWVYSLITIPIILYCAPVVAVLGGRHFITHAALCPGDWVGWGLVVAFYVFASLILTTLHILLTRGRRNAEPGASSNGSPGTLFGNSSTSEGPPSVS